MQNKSEKKVERFKMIDRWKASGKSINSFCKEENVSYYMFLYWRDKYLKQTKPSGFIKIKSAEAISIKDSTCEIVFINGNRINFNSHPEVSYLKELLA